MTSMIQQILLANVTGKISEMFSLTTDTHVDKPLVSQTPDFIRSLTVRYPRLKTSWFHCHCHATPIVQRKVRGFDGILPPLLVLLHHSH